MHKITSFEDDMRKILSQKFWSHGTSLGSLGPLSQGDVHLGFSRPQFLVIWGPYNYPGIVACLVQAENPKLTYSLVWYFLQCLSTTTTCPCYVFLFFWEHMIFLLPPWWRCVMLSTLNGATQHHTAIDHNHMCRIFMVRWWVLCGYIIVLQRFVLLLAKRGNTRRWLLQFFLRSHSALSQKMSLAS